MPKVARRTSVGPSGPDTLAPVGAIVVYTDGACNRNGKPDATGAYSCYVPEALDMSGGWPLRDGLTPTNNRAEYSAFLKAVEIADALDGAATPATRRTLLVVTDSELLQKTVSKWLATWRKKGWVKMNGTPVANQDLCKRMIEACDERAIVVKHVKAHTGKEDADSVGNDHADRLAREASRTQKHARM